jgi:glycerol-3-phosphate dehydrogenase (NAD+)
MSLQAALDGVKQALKVQTTERLEIVCVGGGAWSAVFASLLKRKCQGLEDEVRIRIWRRPGKRVSAAQASKLLTQINQDAQVLQRLRDSGKLLRYVDASLGQPLEPPLTADEILSDGFCDTLEGATLIPMEICNDLEEAAMEADILINGIPSTSTVDVWAPLRDALSRRAQGPPVVISLAKGVEFCSEPAPHILTPTRIIHRCTGIPLDRLLYFGGPNIAIDLWRGEYATARLCGVDELRKPLAELLSQSQLSVWHNRDVITHEVMGGLKNVYAIAAGIVDESSKHSATSNSVLFSNVCAEMTFITHVLSRRPGTLSGPLLADLYVTMLAGRNAWYGRQLAAGALCSADGDIVPGKGHIVGVSAVKAFHSLLANAMVPLGPGGKLCPALDFLLTLRGLHGVLFEGSSVSEFVQGMRLESLEDPAETLLSSEVQDGLAFIPTLLAPDAVAPSHGRGHRGTRKNLSEPFLSDDKLAAIGIDVESMDKFRTEYLAFRAGDAGGAAGEATLVTAAVTPSTRATGGTSPASKNASRMRCSSSMPNCKLGVVDEH